MSGVVKVAGQRGDNSGVVTDNVQSIDNFIGMIQPFATTDNPAGWTACDGAAISRSEFVKLFECKT